MNEGRVDERRKTPGEGDPKPYQEERQDEVTDWTETESVRKKKRWLTLLSARTRVQRKKGRGRERGNH